MQEAARESLQKRRVGSSKKGLPSHLGWILAELANERAHHNDVTKELGYEEVINIETPACSLSEIYRGGGLLAQSETAG